ncbi:hypothetical protein CMV05_05695 [Vibrio anguillarum]|nr:hypothetical protein CMV05_05695 [Vibrio anguillarum]OXX26083.1 hypothetical protein B9J92_07660 [Vibrio sp. V08_P9A1T1]
MGNLRGFMNQCYCGSHLDYQHCCEPIHSDSALAIYPEQLMRARYSAHVLGLVDFVINTYHPSCNAPQQRDAIEESINSQWCGLDVISASIRNNENEGFVHFKAYYTQNQQQFCLQERSRFIRENGIWFYVDGEFPQENTPTKLGRNDPCHCGSGKKFKKCCG